MGVLSDLFGTPKQADDVVDVAASLAPFYVNQTALNIAGGTISVPRAQALSVPAVARANGIITSTVGSLPVEKFNDATGERIPVERSFRQPDSRVPASLIYSYLAQDLWLFGVAYGQVLEMYAASDGDVFAVGLGLIPHGFQSERILLVQKLLVTLSMGRMFLWLALVPLLRFITSQTQES